MKVRVNPKEEFGEVAEIKAALQDELTSGSIVSVSSFPQDADTFRIKLRPTTKQETVIKICKKLSKTGYRTRISLIGDHTSTRHIGCYNCDTATGRHIPTSRTRSIIVTRVNTPNLPENPHGLPKPGGKKPKKKK